jgi:hypothetical protein
MFSIDEEKERLTEKLSDQYSRNIISMEEYERILEYINKIETNKEINIVEKIVYENDVKNNEIAVFQYNEIAIQNPNEKHLSMFSWRTSNIKPVNGYGGKYVSLFGANRVIVDALPKGRTVINVNSIFGMTEIIVPDNVKIINKAVPVFGGIFTQDEIFKEGDELPELLIVGKVVFGNITVKRIKELEKENEFVKKYTEKIYQNIIDKT